jgi:hypothetical protein
VRSGRLSNQPPFIDVAAKTVEFEDGHTEFVEPFSISKHCISIRFFQEFQEATGYVTESERAGGEVYWMNELVEHFSDRERPGQPAFCVSLADAQEFCDWAGFRLPTEAEWLAAMLIDIRIYDTDRGEYPSWCDAQGHYSPLSLPDDALVESAGHEWVSNHDARGNAIARGGPRFYRQVE